MPGALVSVVDKPVVDKPVASQPEARRPARVMPAVATRTFTRHAAEVPAARRFVRSTLAGHPASGEAELLACELVTNAVRHATDAVGVTVAVTCRGTIVHVDVIDDGQAGLPRRREAAPQDEGGRGFQLVNALAQRWGFLRERAGTCVWFELAPE
jgi:anti-sigma regulatory factor (Ser/Thr protein kinase)